jgi:hypothetical protein
METNPMINSVSCFSQMLQLVNRDDFAGAVKEYKGERYAKGFSCWEQFIALLFGQLVGAQSLREISGGLASAGGKIFHLNLRHAPCRSTLAYANQHRPWQVYEVLFERLLAQCMKWGNNRKRKFRFKNPLMSLDATVIDLCLSMYEWATYRSTKGAIKIHLQLNHQGYLPCWALVTEGNVHEVTIAKGLHFETGTVVVIDRGYVDYEMFGAWGDSGVWFVTRLKDNAVYTVKERRPIPKKTNVRRDEIIQLTGVKAQEKCPHRLRRIVVWNEEQKTEIILLTNHLEWGASTIAKIYKDRWQIELFFKALKQNLSIRTFLGTSENAVKTQIWIALIAILLLKFLQLRSTFDWSLSNLAAMIRMNLLTYRNFWRWLNQPFTEPPLTVMANQLPLLP